MPTSLFGLGSSINVNAAGTLVPQSFTGTAGQTVFNITNFTYTPGTNSLLVFINGQRQILARDFVESSPSSFTLIEGVVAGDFVDIIGFPLIVLTAVPAGSISFLQLGTGAIARTLLAKNQDIVSVLDFGAVGDGITDDTLAIQAAVTYTSSVSGRALYWPTPPGGYYRTTVAIRAYGQCDWYGESPTNTVLRNTSSGGAVITIDGTGSLGPYIIRNLKIGGGGCTGITVTGGGYLTYVSQLSLDHVNFESDLLCCINANLIYLDINFCSFGYFTQTATNANHSHIISSFGGANNTNLNSVRRTKFFNSKATYGIALTGGLLWRFEECDWTLNVRNMTTLNITGLVLEQCYTEGCNPVTGQMFDLSSSRVRIVVRGGQYNASVMAAGCAVFGVTPLSGFLCEDADIGVSAGGFTYVNSTTLSHATPVSGLHHFKDSRIQGNAADPLIWLDSIYESAPIAWVPVPTNLTVVNGSGGVTYTGQYTIKNRECFFTIRIVTTGTATTAATVNSTFFAPINASMPLPQQSSTVQISDENLSGTSLGVGLVYSGNGRIYMPGWAARNGNIALSGSFIF